MLLPYVIASSHVESCLTDDALNVKKIAVTFTMTSPNTAALRFKVFKLRYTNQLVFETVVKACRHTADCLVPVGARSVLSVDTCDS